MRARTDQSRRIHRPGGFTILEVMVVALIIGILVTISFPVFAMVRAKAEDGNCSGNLKTLHVSFNAYILDNHEWPQVPEELMNKDEKLWKWFVEELDEYGGHQKYWICPTHYRMSVGNRPVEERPEYFSSYVPTLFDDRAATPFKWRQPWLLEKGDIHGNGAKLLMPDSSIIPYKNPSS